jgi:hypothetical protein
MPPNSSHVLGDVSRCQPDIRSVVVNPSDAVIITTPVVMSVAHDEQQQQQKQQQQPQGSPLTGIHGPIPLWDGTRWHQNGVTCGRPAKPCTLGLAYGYDPRKQPPFFHGTAPRHGCQPGEKELPVDAELAARRSTLQEELRRELEINALRRSSLRRLRQARDNMKRSRHWLMTTLAGVIKKKKLMQLHARLWRGTIAIRNRKIYAGRMVKHYLKIDRRWWTKKLKNLKRELAPMQRELAALEKQEREQTASIDLWFEGLPHEEESFLRWYHEDIKADADGTNSIPSSSRT